MIEYKIQEELMVHSQWLIVSLEGAQKKSHLVTIFSHKRKSKTINKLRYAVL